MNFYHHRLRHVCNVFIYTSAHKNMFNSLIQATYRINTIVLFSEVETRPSRLNVDYDSQRSVCSHCRLQHGLF